MLNYYHPPPPPTPPLLQIHNQILQLTQRIRHMLIIGNASDHQQPLPALVALPIPLLTDHVHAQRMRGPRTRVLLDQRQEIGQNNAQRVTGTSAVAEREQK